MPWDPALLPRLQRSALRLLAVHVRHVVARARQHAREARQYDREAREYELQQQQQEDREKGKEDAQAVEAGWEGATQQQIEQRGQEQQRGRRQQRERERAAAAAATAVRGLLDGAVSFAFRVHQLVGWAERLL